MTAVGTFDVLVTIYGSVMGASGLIQARRAHARRSSHDVSIPMIVVILVGTTLWCAYGIVHHEAVVVETNVVGTLCWLLTLGVVLRWRRVPPPPAVLEPSFAELPQEAGAPRERISAG